MTNSLKKQARHARSRFFCVCGVILLAASLPHFAYADEDGQERLAVRERLHPETEPQGIIYGPLSFYPSLGVGAEYDSNVFASSGDAEDDRAAILAPHLILRFDGSTVKHRFDLGARHLEYDRFDSESRTEARAALRSNRKIANRIELNSYFEAARKFEERGDSLTLTESVKPIGFADLRADTEIIKNFNRFGLGIGGRARHIAYENGRDSFGAELDQSYRDGIIVAASLRPFYDFSPGYRAYARLEVNQRDYEGTDDLDRDSEGFDARGGLEFLLSPILSGAIEIGYLEQFYANPLIPDLDGLSTLSRLRWLATPLMTISLFAARSIAETAAQNAEARIDFSAGVTLDYELRRNVIATVEAIYVNEDFQGTTRSDDVWKIKAKLDYSMNEYIYFNFYYIYMDRQSDIVDFSFDQHRFMVNVTAQY
ncbi:MAG: outer membrane beta-barrel protein [Rhodomicrobium sp.]|nr:outer membrane beta-barrel protein [Rhodomicrobium sp.]